MPPKRLLIFLAVFAFIVGWTIFSPIMDRMMLESKNLTGSLSTSPYGYKALSELLERVQEQPVSLWEHSVMNLPLGQPHTIWFIEPGPGLFIESEAYANRMRTVAEQGHHLVFVLNRRTMKFNPLKPTQPVLGHLKDWYGLDLATENTDLPDLKTVSVKDALPSRDIAELGFLPTEMRQQGKVRQPTHYFNDPVMLNFKPMELPSEQVLLRTENGSPLLVHIPYGKGRITVFPNSFFFQNAQLTHDDNAALAVAIQELTPDQPILFEVYSTGIRNNKDILTYLATGKGFAFMLTCGLMLLALCIWIARRPMKVQYTGKASDERHFTQAHFINALSRHYVMSKDWQGLSRKMLKPLQARLDQLYPGRTLQEQMKAVAENPYYPLSLEALQAVFEPRTISSEAAFIEYSKHVLAVKGKLDAHDSHRTVSRYGAGVTNRR